MPDEVTVIGGGLAGSECALQLASRGVRVTLFEQRPFHSSPAHHGAGFAELVCSNSLKSTRHDSAAGLLKEEITKMGSFLIALAHRASVPAGGALAVDRGAFTDLVTQAIEGEGNISVVREEVTTIPGGMVVVAAGPLCSDTLFGDLPR